MVGILGAAVPVIPDHGLLRVLHNGRPSFEVKQSGWPQGGWLEMAFN